MRSVVLARWLACLSCSAVLVATGGCALFTHERFEALSRDDHNKNPSPLARMHREDARVTGVCTAGSLNYLVDAGRDEKSRRRRVILVDAGFQESGAKLLRAIGDRELVAILLTHAHPDHTAAARALALKTGAQVYVGAGDFPLLERAFSYRASLVRALAFTAVEPPPPTSIRTVVDGDKIPLGNRMVHAIAMPGHTPGSIAWAIVDDETHTTWVFTGDAAQSPLAGAVWPAPPYVTENMRDAYGSLSHLGPVLRALGGERVALYDAHYGRLDDALPAIEHSVATRQPCDRPKGCYDGGDDDLGAMTQPGVVGQP